MESKKINQLATELAPDLSDLTIIGDPTTGISKKITLSQMASLFTGTVEEYATLAAFPLVGVADTIYIALDTNILYRWNTGTSAYVELSPNIVSSLVFNDANGFDGTINLVGSVATLTITTALTTGSVGFIGASGALLQDNANFFWDDTNNRLGLGTNAPTTALDVFGSGIIGRINGTSTNNAYLGFSSAGTNKWSIGNVQSDHRFRIYNEATTSELVSVLSTGEFGIGIANPTTKFHIDGAASALIANLDANVSVAKSISFRSDNSARINLEVSGTESGSNAGADLFIRTYTDAGALLATPLTIVRSTGYSSFASNVAIGKTAGSTFIFDALKEDSTTTGIIGVAQIGRATTGTATDGIGGNIQLTAEDTAGNQRTAGYIAWKLAVASSSAPEGFLSIGSRNASDALNILDSGRIGVGTASPLTNFTLAGTNQVTDSFGQLMVYTTDTQAADKGGQITLGGLFSSSRTSFAAIAGRKTNSSSGDSQGYLSFSTNSGSAITERLRINSAGKIIVAGTTAGTALDDSITINTTNSTGYSGIICTTASTQRGYYGATSTGLEIGTSGTGYFTLWTQGLERLRVTTGGAATELVKITNSLASGDPVNIQNLFTAQAPNNQGAQFLYCGDSSALRLKIVANGGIHNYQANNVNLSDRNTKKEIAPLDSYWNKFKDIEIVKFKYIDQTHEDFNIGVIAQQVEEVAPEFVDTSMWNLEGKEVERKAIYTSDLHHATIKVLQEAMAKIEILETEIAILKAK